MSEQDIELQRRFTEAFNARDVDALIALCDPNIEIHSTFAELGAVYHGHDGLRRWHRDFETPGRTFAWKSSRTSISASRYWCSACGTGAGGRAAWTLRCRPPRWPDGATAP